MFSITLLAGLICLSKCLRLVYSSFWIWICWIQQQCHYSNHRHLFSVCQVLMIKLSLVVVVCVMWFQQNANHWRMWRARTIHNSKFGISSYVIASLIHTIFVSKRNMIMIQLFDFIIFCKLFVSQFRHIYVCNSFRPKAVACQRNSLLCHITSLNSSWIFFDQIPNSQFHHNEPTTTKIDFAIGAARVLLRGLLAYRHRHKTTEGWRSDCRQATAQKGN